MIKILKEAGFKGPWGILEYVGEKDVKGSPSEKYRWFKTN